MKEKKPVGPHKLLKICRRLFFSGALTMLTAAVLMLPLRRYLGYGRKQLQAAAKA